MSTLSEFMRGFAIGAGREYGTDPHWAAFSRSLSDSERERVESGGFYSGLREGRLYRGHSEPVTEEGGGL